MTALIPFTYDREVFRRRVIVKIEQDSEVLDGRDQGGRCLAVAA